jgi:ATP-binding cassette subfamily C (CFTR/MRP) protein 1
MGCYTRIQSYLLLEEDKRSSKVSSTDGKSNSSRPEDISADIVLHEKSVRSITLHEIKKGSFAYEPLDRCVVSDLSLEILSGSVTLVLGPVGSGKSTLLKAMLGEVEIRKGSMQSDAASVGYCPHDPWLPNLSLRDIITGVSEFDEEWFTTVLHVCALDEDLPQLSKGVHTLVGTKGAVLSGGQRQRLVSRCFMLGHMHALIWYIQSLARALYARTPLILLDDVFSGLDKRTEETVLQRVLDPNSITRSLGIAFVVATHHSKNTH